MAEKKLPTLEQHQRFGAELKDLRDRLLAASVEVSNAYPHRATGPKLLARALAALDAARSELDSRVSAENPTTPNDVVVNCYYGRPDS